jgi:hypothetical protein
MDSDEELDLLLKECMEKVFNYKTPDPSELPTPSFVNQKLVLIVSNDKMSTMMLEILKPNLDKFDICFADSKGICSANNSKGIDCVKIIGFPTVYDPKTKKSHLGVTYYKSLINFFK